MSLWSQGCHTPALVPEQGKGKWEWGQQVGAGAGAFSAARHSMSGDVVGNLGHGHLSRCQQLGNWHLATPRNVKTGAALSQSSELFCLAGLPGQHCDVTGRGRSHTDTCPGALGQSGALLPVPGTVSCLLSGIQSSFFLLLVPQAAHRPRFTNCPAPCCSHCRKGDAAHKEVQLSW